ncbi:shikimate kinase [Pedobacter metabolipauper]|uniref:Shikimate kinase n=1 Tax=Pedobacter metabolipauper TaxID=425513 RepID=A0A4R6SXU2_9SPHI|nr:shikimate kinase [Pedobacter metabolipauper]TDQ10321.1 shikimate kinase [Pedobacter metabolipauper]
MKIFLVGFMGCGKSTLGKKLAIKLGYTFIDLDHQLEKAVGTSVGNYFAAEGEDAFRKMESKVIKEFDYPQNCIVATGGGAPCYYDNMEFINRKGITIYIQLPPAALAKRLENGKDKRPLLKDLDEKELISYIKSKLEEREPYYKCAFLTVSGINLNPEQLLNQLF